MKAETTHKATQENGPSVQEYKLRWVSASGLTTADPNSFGGCLRKWWYDQVAGKRAPSTKAQTRGTKLHSSIERYLLGGPLVDPLAVAGKRFIPEPGPGLLVEASLGTVDAPYLRLADVPVLGHVDLWNHRGFYQNVDGETIADAPKTLETKDWKTTSELKYAKSVEELALNLQLNLYGELGFRMWPAIELARLTHVYFQTQGTPECKLVTVVSDREHVTRRTEYAEGLTRTVRDAARETNPDKVDGNRDACTAYRGCPHRAYCSIGNHDSLSSWLGRGSTESVIHRLTLLQENPVGLIDRFKPDANTPPPPAVQPSAVDAEMAALQAAENARRAQAASGIPTGFKEAIEYLQTCGRGWPKFTGRAAKAVVALLGLDPRNTEIQGQGWLDTKCQPVEDPELVLRLVNEVRTLPPLAAEPVVATAPPPPPAPAPAPVPMISVLPPDAPASNPALAALPVEGLDNAKTRALAAATNIAGLAATAAIVQQTGALPSMLTGAMPIVQAAVATPTPAPAPPVHQIQPGPSVMTDAVNGAAAAAVNVPPAPAPRKRGRPAGTKKKTENGPTAETPTENTSTGTEIYLYVNCIPSVEYESLHPYIDELCDALCKEFSAADIRCAPKDGPLGFGKWTGALAALARTKPPTGGSYFVRTNGNDIASVVVEALRGAVVASGGLYVEGVA